jgi:hypothetical protein
LRFERDAAEVASGLSTDGDLGGLALTDLRKVCER